jgi:aminoglycoside phosphotransferase
MLIPARDTERTSVQPLIIGDTFLGHQVVRCIQSVEDTAVFQLRGATGRLYALKIASGELTPQTAAAFSTEAAVLLRLKGRGAPTLHNYNTYRDHPFLLMDWCGGEASNRAAYELPGHG